MMNLFLVEAEREQHRKGKHNSGHELEEEVADDGGAQSKAVR
jgi:hypothetical protein